MNLKQRIAEFISRYHDKNLSTFSARDGSEGHYEKGDIYVQAVISPLETWGSPQQSPYEGQIFELNTKLARLSATTTYGGSGSKYQSINEASFFYGHSDQGTLFCGVVDGCGGSRSGYLGSRIATETLATQLISSPLSSSLFMADKNVNQYAQGGYATGVALVMTPEKKITLSSKGDCRALTIRQQEILRQGSTEPHNPVYDAIQRGELPPQAMHTAKNRNVVSSIIGDVELPVYESQFAGEAGDQIIIASDGLWDIVTEYEVLQLAQKLKGENLQRSLYHLALGRNSSAYPYMIKFAPHQDIVMPAMIQSNGHKRGDNITIQVIEIK